MTDAELLNQAKKQTTLLALDYKERVQERRSTNVRRSLILGGLLCLIITRYMALRAEYKELFQWFSQWGRDSYTCAFNNVSAWSIVMNLAYPWLGKILFENPLTQYSCRFIWYVVYNGLIPSQDQINTCVDKQPSDITPLDFLCGSVAAKYNPDINALLTQLKQGDNFGPWCTILKPNSMIIDGQHDAELTQFITNGFVGLAKWSESSSTSADTLFTIVYGTTPKTPCKSTASQILNTVTGAATGVMVGASFKVGEEAAMPFAGPIIGGLIMGGLTLFSQLSDNQASKCSY